MKDERKLIPLVVGVTAHRSIREQDRPALYAAVKGELQKLRARCPDSPLLMLNSLAEGGDLLCADAAAELGIPLVAPLPVEREQYELDFSPEGRKRFLYHCERAQACFVAPFTEAEPETGPTRDYRFRQAGIYVAAHSHVLLALWDGGPGTAAACGTAETVSFALFADYIPHTGLCLRTESDGAVVHIFTPRGERCGEPAGTVHLLGDWAAAEDCLRKTDCYNREARLSDSDRKSRLPADTGNDEVLLRMEVVGGEAGRFSGLYARRYRRVLALLAVASALLTFAFLMYDEAEAIWMILACGALLLGAWHCQRYAVRSDCHRRYIEYRALAECLRVQTYLRYAGSRLQAAELLSWSQQEEIAWVMAALYALEIGAPPQTRHDIRDCWVEEQRRYHENAAVTSDAKLRVSERVVQAALLLSVTLYFAAVGFELCCGGLIFSPLLRPANVELYRTVLKIVLGTISAVTLFVANYYGRQSLPRVLSDHQKMARFYNRAGALLEQHGQSEELLAVLAREELIENGNWLSYQRDNKPDMSV